MRRWLVLTIVLGTSWSAWAQPASRAEKLARELFEAGEFAAARGQFVRAYEDSPVPGLLFEIALTYQGEGFYRQAQLYFERYAAEVPASDPNRAEAERLAQLMRRSADRGEVAPGRDSPDRLLPLFEDTALAGDEEEEAAVDDDDDDGDDAVELDEPSRERTARVLFWTSSVLAAAAATTLIVSAYNVDHYEDELNDAVLDSLNDPDPQHRIEGEGDACEVAGQRSGPHAERAQAACDDGRSWARTANIMTVGLLATGISSMYLLYVGYLKEDPEEEGEARRQGRRTVVAPSVAPDRVGMELTLSF